MTAEFDAYAARYEADHARNIAITGEAPDYFAEYKIRETARLMRRERVAVRRLLDFGAGIGNSVPHFRRYFPQARVTLADPSRESLELATRRFPGEEEAALIDDGGRLPFADNHFDLCFTACVFHHIPHARHQHWLAELRRVTQPGGATIVFEHNPFNPLTRHAVNTCPFDVNARLLLAMTLRRTMRRAGWRHLHTQYHVFFPAALAALRPLEARFAWVPFGGQYSVWSRK